MLRSFIPFVLATLGFIMLSWADRMPLFRWQVSEIVTDFSSTCDFKLPSSPWTTRWGESLDLRGRPYHLENLKVVVKRSQTNEVLDRVSLTLYNNTSWLFGWSLVEVVASISYIWVFLLQDKQNRVSHALMAAFLTGMAVFICLLLSQVHIVSLAGPTVGWAPYYFRENCHGTITFSARLLKIYYETPAILFAGILMELGALGMMFVIQKKKLQNG
jgi:hypothetical protein